MVPNSPILTPAVSAIIPRACMFESFPWSVPIPVVVYLFTCSIDLKPSLRANLTSFAVESFWKSKNGLVLPKGLSDGSSQIFFLSISFEQLISKFS